MPELQDYYCLDFTGLENQQLQFSSNEKILSVISIYIYSCQVIDNIKSFTPDNCANQTDINNLIDDPKTLLSLKLYTQQYNIDSKQYEVSFKNEFIFPQSNQYFLQIFKAQNQITKVKDGFIIQSESYNSNPIQYEIQNQVFSNSNDNPYLQVDFQIDEVVQKVSIQYATFPEILALVNSAFTFLIVFGFFCKSFSQKAILIDLIQIFKQNMHQSCLREDQNQNQILEKKSSDTIQQQNFQVEEEEILDDQGTFNINVPNLMVKSKYSVEVNQIRQQNENTTEDFFSTLQDDIFEKDQQKQLKNKQKPNFKQKQQLIKNSYFKRYQQNKKTQLVSTFQEKVFSNKIRKKSLSLSPLRRQPQKNQNLSQSNICSDDLNNKAHQQFSHQQNEQKEKFCGIFQNNRELCQSEYKFHDSQQSQKFSLQQNDYAITRLYTNSSSNNYIISPKLNEKQIVDNQGDLISQSQNTNTCMQHLSQRELILEEENKKISLGKNSQLQKTKRKQLGPNRDGKP